MTANEEEIYFAAVCSNLKVFLQQAFRTIYPASEFMDNWHIDAIVYRLELAIEGEEPRLIINLPPRQLKSFIVSVALPAFILGMDPAAKVICVSYSDELARALSRDFRRIVESPWYRRYFSNVKPTKMTETEFATDVGGGRYATSVGGTLTGRGGDFIIIDDPLKPADAQSDRTRESVNEWYRDTLLSRLDDKKRSLLIIVMQRLHVNDLTGFAQSDDFEVLSLPALARRDEKIPTSDTEYYFRAAGEPLHAEREDEETLERIRRQLGTYNFAAQYQQHPDTPEGGMFRRRWFKLVDRIPPPPRRGNWFITIDTATSTALTADYSVVTVVYGDEAGYWIVRSDRGHWDYEVLKRKALEYRRHIKGELYYVVEAEGVGIPLIIALRTARLTCFHYDPKTSKLGRAAQAVPAIEFGRVHILNVEGRNQWVEPYLNEFTTFPNSRHDDQVDALTQLLIWAERRFNPFANYVRPEEFKELAPEA